MAISHINGACLWERVKHQEAQIVASISNAVHTQVAALGDQIVTLEWASWAARRALDDMPVQRAA